MDLNADGHNDILSGSYSRMGQQPMAGTFQVLWGKPDGSFKKAETLSGTDGEPLIIPSKGEDDIVESICTRPFAVDWDGDGDLDLVVGNFAGKFHLFTGEGKGKFQPKSEPILAGKEPLLVPGHHGDPFVIDWDKDGDLDIVSGSDGGGVFWAENTAGAKKKPELKQFAAIIKPREERIHECRPDEVKEPAGSTRVWVADVNGDGKLDILVGDNISLVSPAAGVSEEEYKKRREEWQKAYSDAAKAAQAETDEEKRAPLYEKMNNLYQSRSEFMTEDRTGFVWLYLQK
ncbi:MAG: VCBS repeat-containing protein [Phycisphaerales bacterium]|nr:VCBS repeat-containing protein [Phycisphaerales bacterium]